jgi:hypothetical protein
LQTRFRGCVIANDSDLAYPEAMRILVEARCVTHSLVQHLHPNVRFDVGLFFDVVSELNVVFKLHDFSLVTSASMALAQVNAVFGETFLASGMKETDQDAMVARKNEVESLADLLH